MHIRSILRLANEGLRCVRARRSLALSEHDGYGKLPIILGDSLIGRTADSGFVSPGSSPGLPASKLTIAWAFLFSYGDLLVHQLKFTERHIKVAGLTI